MQQASVHTTIMILLPTQQHDIFVHQASAHKANMIAPQHQKT